MNYWDRRAEQKRVETDGVPVSHPHYPSWTFWVRQISQWLPHYERAIARIVAADKSVAEYRERTSSPDYVPTDEDAALEARYLQDTFVEGCLARWDVTDRYGAALPLTPHTARQLMTEFDDVYRALVMFAADEKNYPLLTASQKAERAAGN